MNNKNRATKPALAAHQLLFHHLIYFLCKWGHPDPLLVALCSRSVDIGL